MAPSPVPARQPGRPRRFDAETEIRLIVDAAKELLRENDYEHVGVGEILEKSGLSTRSFYRHFGSKDELLMAMYRQNAEQTGAMLQQRVAAARSPREALETWVNEMLRLRFDARTARRVAIFDAPSARRAAGYGEAERQASMSLITPLVEALEAGRADGSFPLTRPKRDARSIYALVWDVMRWERQELTRAEALQHVLRFSLPGLGVHLPG